MMYFVLVGMLKRKILVLDLDETLIHSHHDGVLRQTVKPGTPPDFVLKASFIYYSQVLWGILCLCGILLLFLFICFNIKI